MFLIANIWNIDVYLQNNLPAAISGNFASAIFTLYSKKG